MGSYKGFDKDKLKSTIIKQSDRYLAALRLAVIDTLRQSIKIAQSLASTKTGELRRNIASSGKIYDNGLKAFYGSNLVYSRIQEFGGDIRPKTKSYLTIPLNRDAQRISAGELKLSGDTYVRRTKSGKLIVFQKGKGGQDIPMYLLVKSVHINARPYLRPSASQARYILTENIKAYVNRTKSL